MARRSWSCLLIVVALLMFGPATIQGATRQDSAEGGDYYVGYLTWKAGRGGISWSPGSGEDGGPGSNVQDDVYDSAPLPRDLYLNSSRSIHVDLFTAKVPTLSWGNTSCAGEGLTIGAEIRAGDKLLGGNLPGRTQFAPTARFPDDPPGYGVCRIRIAPELSYLPAGTVLRLKITHGAEDTNHPLYGMQGRMASVIRLPFFGDFEMPYRHPAYANGAPETPRTDPIGGQFLGGIGLLAGAAAMRARSRKALMFACLIGLLLTSAFAGCMGSKGRTPATSDDGFPATTVEPAYQEGNLSSKGMGAIIGQVAAADIAVPISGAAVAILGSPHFVYTDSYGRFAFSDLEPGAYKVRVDREGYGSLEVAVKVVADLIARLNLTMHPVGVQSAADRPHLHDYWGEAKEISLLERKSLGYQCPSTANHLFLNPCFPIMEFRIDPPTDPTEYRSVLPGTYQVEIIVDFDRDEMAVGTVALTIQTPNDPSSDNDSLFLPRAPGEPFHVATTWEMSDPGHQHFSTWTFRLWPMDEWGPQDRVSEAQRNLARWDAAPTYSVSLRIQKGVVPLEPSHREFWRGEQSLDLVQHSQRQTGLAFLTWHNYYQDPMDWYYREGGWWNMAWFPRVIVPPETTWVEVHTNLTRPMNPAYPLEFRFKTTETGAPTIGCWRNAQSGPGVDLDAHRCDGPEYQRLPRQTPQGTSLRWVIPVAPTEADPFYATRSFWVFGMEPAPDATTAALARADATASGALKWNIEVIAHKGAMP